MEERPGTDEQADVAEEQSASGAGEESENGLMNRLIRGVGRFFGSDEDSADAGEQDADPKATETVTLTKAELQEQVNRQAQAETDRRETQRSWDSALKAADADDYGPLAELAAKGNQKAERELAKRGATYELGEARGKSVQAETQSNAENERLAIIAGGFDEALLAPVLEALPEADRNAILGDGIAGLEGRKSAVTKALGVLIRNAEKGAAEKLLDDEKFVKDLLGDSEFRKQLLKNPVTNKQLRSYFRGELDEPDLNPGNGRGSGGERENDVMNDGIRRAARGADFRAPLERAAGGRRPNRDLLDDDE